MNLIQAYVRISVDGTAAPKVPFGLSQQGAPLFWKRLRCRHVLAFGRVNFRDRGCIVDGPGFESSSGNES